MIKNNNNNQSIQSVMTLLGMLLNNGGLCHFFFFRPVDPSFFPFHILLFFFARSVSVHYNIKNLLIIIFFRSNEKKKDRDNKREPNTKFGTTENEKEKQPNNTFIMYEHET